MNKKDTEALVSTLARPIAEENGLSLWDVEYVKEGGRYFLRVYIDKPGGVSVDDCETVSRALDPLLDEKDPIAESYFLEVSSAGLERPLRRESDFAAFMGSTVEISLYKPVLGGKSHRGSLALYDGTRVAIETPAGRAEFAMKDVSVVRTVIDI